MSSSSRPLPPALAQFALALLTREAGDERTPAEQAAATVRVCQDLSEHLSRIIGRAGVRGLLERSIILTQNDFPWLAEARSKSPADPLAWLPQCLEHQPPKVAFEASVALVTRFLDMLGRFIGDALVLRLLAEVWPDVFPPSAEKVPT